MIILLCGYKGCGKDTCANYLVNKYNFTHLKFAQPLKEVLRILFDFDDEQLEGKCKETIDDKWQVSPRNAMTFVGTDLFQYHINDLLPNIGRTFWAKHLINRLDTSQNIVISDLRFVHELCEIKDNIKDTNVYVVKITRPNMIIHERKIHVSETEHLNIIYDCVIENVNINDFHKNIDTMLLSIK